MIERIQDEDGFIDYHHITGELKRVIGGAIGAVNSEEETTDNPAAPIGRATADLNIALFEAEAKAVRLAQELNAAAQREMDLLEELAICRTKHTCLEAREQAAQDAALKLRKQLALMNSKPLASASCSEGESRVAHLLIQLEVTEAKVEDLERRLRYAEILFRTRSDQARNDWENRMHISGDGILMDPNLLKFDRHFDALLHRKKQSEEELRRKEGKIMRRCETAFALLHA